MPINTFYTTGIHQEIISFNTDAERLSWETQVMEIKAESSSIFAKKEAEGLTAAVRALYDQWFARIQALKDAFGEDRVPQDIKWALNSAEEGLGVVLTEWANPPNREIFEN